MKTKIFLFFFAIFIILSYIFITSRTNNVPVPIADIPSSPMTTPALQNNSSVIFENFSIESDAYSDSSAEIYTLNKNEYFSPESVFNFFNIPSYQIQSHQGGFSGESDSTSVSITLSPYFISYTNLSLGGSNVSFDITRNFVEDWLNSSIFKTDYNSFLLSHYYFIKISGNKATQVSSEFEANAIELYYDITINNNTLVSSSTDANIIKITAINNSILGFSYFTPPSVLGSLTSKTISLNEARRLLVNGQRTLVSLANISREDYIREVDFSTFNVTSVKEGLLWNWEDSYFRPVYLFIGNTPQGTAVYAVDALAKN